MHFPPGVMVQHRRAGLHGAGGGSFAASEAFDLSALVGRVLVLGALFLIEGGDIAAASGRVLVSGGLSASEVADSASLAGAVMGDPGVSGVLAATDMEDAATLSGRVLIAGGITAIEANDTPAFAGGVIIAGNLAGIDSGDIANLVGGVMIAGALSATDPSDTAVFAGAVSDPASAVRQAPDALLTQTNLSGAVTAIDEDPDSPDANWLTAVSNNADSVCAVSFPTPSAAPQPGAGLQEFRVQARLTANGTACTYNIYLRESGTRLNGGLAIGTGSLTSTTGQVVAATWNANLLGTSNGSAVECEFQVIRSGGSPGSRTTGEVGAIEWNAFG